MSWRLTLIFLYRFLSCALHPTECHPIVRYVGTKVRLSTIGVMSGKITASDLVNFFIRRVVTKHALLVWSHFQFSLHSLLPFLAVDPPEKKKLTSWVVCPNCKMKGPGHTLNQASTNNQNNLVITCISCIEDLLCFFFIFSFHAHCLQLSATL